ncbi:hypothetical protein D9M71_297620 [compost metagenome]
MKQTFIAGTFLLASVLSAGASADMRVLDSAKGNPKNTLNYSPSSLEVLQKGDVAVGTFSLNFDNSVNNMKMTIRRKSCIAGEGTLYFFDMGMNRVTNTVDWVEDDGSLADSAAQLLCAQFKTAKKAGGKR